MGVWVGCEFGEVGSETDDEKFGVFVRQDHFGGGVDNEILKLGF